MIQTIRINKNRKFHQSSIKIGYLDENNIEKLKFVIPENFKNYNKKVCLKVGDVVFGKLLDNDVLTLTNDITQYNELDLSIEFFDNNNNIIARTSKMHLIIEDTIVCDDVSPDEPKVILLNELIEQVNTMDIDATDTSVIIQRKDGTIKKVKVSSGTGSGVADSVEWDNVQNKPSTYTPSDHTHTTSEITDFPTIPSKTSQLNNDSGFITEIPSEYITETELNEKGYLTNVPSEYKTKNENDELYQPKGDYLTGYTETDPTVPSYVKNITTTDISNWNNKVDKIEGKSLVADTEITRLSNVSNYDDTEIKTELKNKANSSDIPTKISQLDNDENYIKQDDYMADKETFLTEYDLIDYAKVDELEQKVAIIPYKNTYTEEEVTKYGQLITNSFDESWSALNPLYVSYLGMMIPYSSRLNTTNLLFGCEITNYSNSIYYLELQITLTDDNKLSKIEKILEKKLIDEDVLNSKGYLTEHQDLSGKQDVLISGSNIKTINGNSLIGSGNINISSGISSDVVKTIQVVDELPETEVEGVLYLVKEIIETLVNLYPSQVETTSSNGFTITFKDKNVIVTGSNSSSSVWGETEQFAMDLEANKTYYLQFTHESGTMDDSDRVANSDGIITSIILIGYDSSGNATYLINEDERTASGVYEKYTFTPTQEFASYKLRLQTKKYVICSDWNLSIVVAEESE